MPWKVYLRLARTANRLGLALLAAAGLAGCQGVATPVGSNRLQVVASILPLADFVRQVGGERVQVETLIPAGASPHTYELTPAQMQTVSRAGVLVLNGVQLEFWAADLISAANNPNLIVVYTAEGLDILEETEADADGAAPAGGNPHVWLSPRNAMHQVEHIREALIQADPAGTEIYRAQTDGYLAQLHKLDDEFTTATASFSTKKFIAFHSAWVYLARDYGLEQAAVIVGSPGKEPSPAEIAAIVETAKAVGARAIFAEPQFSPKAAEIVAEECGARVLFLEPLGQPPDYRYLDMMRYNLAEMSLALQ